MFMGEAEAQPLPGVRDEGMVEQRRERLRQDGFSVPQQNRESHRGDAIAGEVQGSREWLKEAQQALRSGQTGQANEYLERAATRLLSRSTEPARAGEPMRNLALDHISGAREALWRRDRREADRQIELAIAAR